MPSLRGNNQFCLRGHDKYVTGVYGKGSCRQCFKDNYRTTKAKDFTFCLRSHDTRITGRDKWSACNACKSQLNRWKRIKRSYGLSKKQYEDLLKDQDGICKICGDLPENQRDGSLYID